jgi:LuxR family transcriptional regulator, maltose regulon positive regulatory protein
MVLRPRLIERLNEARQCKLTLISAPAGFGKTTLVSEWIENFRLQISDFRLKNDGATHSGNLQSEICNLKFCWLSLDEGDNDPTRFLIYLVSALRTAAPNMGAGVLETLQTPQPPPTEQILTALLNEITTLSETYVLVLDDYHLIDSKPVDLALNFLLEHLPPQMHLVITTREDPQLPLARLRAQGRLLELRAADLRFSPEEAGIFLNRMMNLNLSAENIAALEMRTEGWIAGLQLAALSMQGREDVDRFIQAFTGSHRFILDYLVEEVLQRQSEQIRSFLLQTAILDRFCAPLCNAVTEREDSKKMLEAMELGNLFVVPMDDSRQWYRYHHLFADVLQARLMEEQLEQVSSLHRRASLWHEQNGWPSEAIRHALAGKDFERAAGLIELAWSGMDSNYQSATWIGWAKALPEEIIRARPVLCAGYAWALLDGGELEASEARLRDAERWLEGSPVGMVVVDEEQFRCLPASIATAQAYRVQALGDIPGTIMYARQALDIAHADDFLRRIQATALLGMALYASGDLEAAGRSLGQSAAYMLKAGDAAGPIGIGFVLADMKVVSGQLNEATRIYQQSLSLLEGQDKALPVGTSEIYRGLGELCCERGDLDTAAQHLRTSKSLAEQAALTNWQPRLKIAEASLKEAQGDPDGAVEALDEAERLNLRSPLPEEHPIAALRTQIWIRQGRLAEAQRWARDQGLTPDDELSFSREFEHITLARLLIARYQFDQIDSLLHAALHLLARLLQAAQAGGRMGSAIEVLVLQALANRAQGDLPLALGSLERALALAEPEGYCRIFIHEGAPIAELLAKLEEKGVTAGKNSYVDRLLAAFGIVPKDVQPATTANRGASHPILVEAISARELEVLKLLRTELSGPEIARELVVSLNTMRTHTKNIFNKLGVNNRRAAVRRAQELGLI